MASLTALEELSIGGWGHASDLTPLRGLVNLRTLYARDQGISDISVLAQLPQLTDVHLPSNAISDISVLAQVPKLTNIDLSHNPVSDLTPLGAKDHYQRLWFQYDEITDMSPLRGVTTDQLWMDIKGCAFCSNPIHPPTLGGLDRHLVEARTRYWALDWPELSVSLSESMFAQGASALLTGGEFTHYEPVRVHIGSSVLKSIADASGQISIDLKDAGLAPGAYEAVVVDLFSGRTSSVAFEVTPGSETVVVPTAPGQSDPCGTVNDTYTIPATTGVEYLVDGTVKAAGSYAGSGTVMVAAKTIPGYILSGTSTWTLTFSNAECPADGFTDITPETQFFTEMMWMKEAGISTGWDDGTYRPWEPVNRDAMAAFMYRLAGSPEFTPPVVSPFADITPQTQFYTEMMWMKEAGISTGWDDGTYRPWEPVNRDAMAAFMYRLHNDVLTG